MTNGGKLDKMSVIFCCKWVDNMWCEVSDFGTLKSYRYVVTLSKYQGKMLFSRHKKRTTWETQGGHIEAGETPMEAARRELYEECGATAYTITPLCDYAAGDELGKTNGQVFFADIQTLGPLPESEMAEIQQFDGLPEALSYPGITPMLFERLQQLLKEK